MQASSIAFFFLNDFPAGGAEQITANVASSLSQLGHKVTVFCKNLRQIAGEAPSMYPFEVVEHHCEKDEKSILPTLIADFRQRNIKICFFPVFYYCYARELREATGCKIVYANHSVPFWEVIARKAYRKARALRHPLYGLRWIVSDYWRIYYGKCYEKKFSRRYRALLEEVDAYTVLCNGYRQELISQLHLNAKLAQKIHVVHNGCPLPQNEQDTKKEKQIIFVGRLEYADKRPDRLLKIWEIVYNLLPDWELIFVGDGNQRQKLAQIVLRKGLPRVSFVGFQQDVSPFLDKAAILCLTSNFEGWPLVVTEAQQHGVVPIGFDVCAGMEEQFGKNNEYGLLITPFDYADYAHQLTALATDSQRLASMRQAVRLWGENFSLQHAVSAHEELIDQLLQS